MRIRFLASLLLASATLSANAFADTVTFGSTSGVTTFVSPSAGSGTAVGYQHPNYTAPLGASAWVSTTASGGNQAAETVKFTNTFTLLAGESYSGSFSFLADNAGGVLVNGLEVYAINPATGFSFPTTISLLPNYFHAGLNSITLEVANRDGPVAADFVGSVNGVAVTPEPSSLVLLGTGLLGLAGAARRRFRTV